MRTQQEWLDREAMLVNKCDELLAENTVLKEENTALKNGDAIKSLEQRIIDVEASRDVLRTALGEEKNALEAELKRIRAELKSTQEILSLTESKLALAESGVARLEGELRESIKANSGKR